MPPARQAAMASAAFCFWCAPGQRDGPAAGSVTKSIDAADIPRRGRAGLARLPAIARAETAGTCGLMMPAFSAAISASVSPSHFW